MGNEFGRSFSGGALCASICQRFCYPQAPAFASLGELKLRISAWIAQRNVEHGNYFDRSWTPHHIQGTFGLHRLATIRRLTRTATPRRTEFSTSPCDGIHARIFQHAFQWKFFTPAWQCHACLVSTRNRPRWRKLVSRFAQRWPRQLVAFAQWLHGVGILLRPQISTARRRRGRIRSVAFFQAGIIRCWRFI